MKKLVFATFLFLSVLCPSMAEQNKNHFAINLSPTYGLMGDVSYKADMSIMYRRDIGNYFHIGGGLGYGISKLNRSEYGEVNAYNIGYIPVFLDAKIDFASSPSCMYFDIKVGTQIAQTKDKEVWIPEVKDYSNIWGYYPYIAFAKPSIGYEFPIGNNKIGLEIGLDLTYGSSYTTEFVDNGKVEDIMNYISENTNGGRIYTIELSEGNEVYDVLYYKNRIFTSVSFGLTYSF